MKPVSTSSRLLKGATYEYSVGRMNEGEEVVQGEERKEKRNNREHK